MRRVSELGAARTEPNPLPGSSKGCRRALLADAGHQCVGSRVPPWVDPGLEGGGRRLGVVADGAEALVVERRCGPVMCCWSLPARTLPRCASTVPSVAERAMAEMWAMSRSASVAARTSGAVCSAQCPPAAANPHLRPWRHAPSAVRALASRASQRQPSRRQPISRRGVNSTRFLMGKKAARSPRGTMLRRAMSGDVPIKTDAHNTDARGALVGARSGRSRSWDSTAGTLRTEHRGFPDAPHLDAVSASR